jgi:hypothetical protein
MKSPDTERPPGERLPYERPTVKSVSLVVGEVLGVNCKVMSVISFNANQRVPCVANDCFTTYGS